MYKWRKVTLGSVTENFDSKRRPVKTAERIAGQYPYYGASGVIDYVEDFLLDGDYLLIAEDGENLRTRSTPIAFLARGKIWVNNHAHVVKGNEFADTRFLCHLLSMTDIAGYLTGSTQPKLTRSAMDQIEVSIPEVDTQRAIAEVLGALDDKIAANTQLVQSLDELFMTLGRQHLRKDVESSSSLESLIYESIGGDWGAESSSPAHSERVRCIRGADILSLQGAGLGKMPERFLKSVSLDKRRTRHGDIVVEMSGGSPTQSTGRAAFISDQLLERVDAPVVSSNFCRVLRVTDPANALSVYALLRLDWDRGEFFQYENGSTGIKNLAFKEYSARRQVPNFTSTELASFDDRVVGLLNSARSFGSECDALAATRDALLPQLMSGALRIKDAEKAIEEVL